MHHRAGDQSGQFAWRVITSYSIHYTKLYDEHDASYSGFPERAKQIGLTDPQPGDAPLNREKINYALTTQYAYSFMDTATVCQFCYGLGWQFMDIV